MSEKYTLTEPNSDRPEAPPVQDRHLSRRWRNGQPCSQHKATIPRIFLRFGSSPNEIAMYINILCTPSKDDPSYTFRCRVNTISTSCFAGVSDTTFVSTGPLVVVRHHPGIIYSITLWSRSPQKRSVRRVMRQWLMALCLCPWLITEISALNCIGCENPQRAGIMPQMVVIVCSPVVVWAVSLLLVVLFHTNPICQSSIQKTLTAQPSVHTHFNKAHNNFPSRAISGVRTFLLLVLHTPFSPLISVQHATSPEK